MTDGMTVTVAAAAGNNNNALHIMARKKIMAIITNIDNDNNITAAHKP